jgi:hypothetical protein
MDVASTTLGLFRLAMSFLALFIVPGFAFSYALFPKKETSVLERLILTIPLSIAVSIVPVFVANYLFDIRTNVWLIAANALFWTFAFAGIFLLQNKKVEKRAVKKKSLLLKDTKPERQRYIFFKVASVVVLALFAYGAVFSIHQGYRFPYHTDEWYNIWYGVEVLDSGGVREQLKDHRNLEMGFSLFYAEFILLSGQDPVTFYQYLPALIASISSVIVFLSIYRISGNYFTAFFSALFFAGLKTNITVLGVWFFVPLTLCIPLVYSVFYLLAAGLENGSFKHIFAASIILLGISLIHPCSASFIFPVILLYLAMRPDNVKKNLYGLACLFSIPFFSFIYFIKFFWQGDLDSTLRFFADYLVFPVKEFLPWEYYLFLPGFYGEAAIALAVVGIFSIYAYNQNKLKIYVAWAMWTVGSLYMFYNLKFILISPYERTVYYTVMALVPLSGIGLYQVFSWTNQILQRADRRVALTVCVILFLAVYASHFSNYYKYKPDLYRVIDESDYEGITKLAERGVYHNKIMAQAHTSFTIFPISRNYVVATSPRTSAPGKNVLDAEKFFGNSTCEEKNDILKRYNVDYVYSPARIDCQSLREIYQKSERFIYKTGL